MRIPAAFGRLLGIHNAVSGAAFLFRGFAQRKEKPSWAHIVHPDSFDEDHIWFVLSKSIIADNQSGYNKNFEKHVGVLFFRPLYSMWSGEK